MEGVEGHHGRDLLSKASAAAARRSSEEAKIREEQGMPSPDKINSEGEPEDAWKAILLFYVVLIVMVMFQMAIVWAKKRHPKRFAQITLAGLWAVPAMLAVLSRFWRFLAVWLAWSCITGYMLRIAMQKPLASTTPRRVYAWFLLSHRVTMPIATVGVALVVGNFFGLGLLESLFFSPDTQILLFWYGVYFGVLTRDCAEVSSDLMAGTMGVGNATEGHRLGFSMNHCGICMGQLPGLTMRSGEELQPGAEGHIRLPCKHAFHDYCIRGWTMVGKKDMCPTCLEKVDLKSMHADHPWEKMGVAWSQLLDLFRYLVVWFPILLVIVEVFFYELGLLPKNPHTDGVAPTEATATPIPDATPTLTPVPDATPAAPAATPILA